MKRLLLSAVFTASAAGALLTLAATPASAGNGPIPPTCQGSSANDGQAAATVQSFLGANGQPGLSSGNRTGVAQFVLMEHFNNCGF